MRNSFSKKLELVQPDEGGNEFHVDNFRYDKQSPYNRISSNPKTIDHPLSAKNMSKDSSNPFLQKIKAPKKSDVKYEIKIDLIKMDVEVIQTTKF